MWALAWLKTATPGFLKGVHDGSLKESKFLKQQFRNHTSTESREFPQRSPTPTPPPFWSIEQYHAEQQGKSDLPAGKILKSLESQKSSIQKKGGRIFHPSAERHVGLPSYTAPCINDIFMAKVHVCARKSAWTKRATLHNPWNANTQSAVDDTSSSHTKTGLAHPNHAGSTAHCAWPDWWVDTISTSPFLVTTFVNFKNGHYTQRIFSAKQIFILFK